MDSSQLNRDHAIADALRFEETPIGPRAIITTAACTAEVYLQGAHVTRYTAGRRRELLYLSPRTSFVPGKAIRGGIPIVFPWFGDRSDGQSGAAHGFARTAPWALAGAQRVDDDLELRLTLAPDEHTRQLGYDHFEVEARILAGRLLTVDLRVRNTGTEPWTFEAALHTYLAVDDVRRVEIVGLAGTRYVDKTDAQREKRTPDTALIFTKEVDQVHLGTEAGCLLVESGRPRVEIQKSGSRSTVVWNPWVEKTAKLQDLEPEAWQRFVCIETGNIGEDRITLRGGETHTMTAVLRGL